ncbi:DUF4198 domain-containing protein [Actibacterium ureilyticum]|uniref:DUF4198 domain-containing protein n=1 Tax=Actibacterium ureilyticum TaxID=1590614 RepID=UPI001595CF09|nr:DUF4198 domain-containing protein [Actibacterium ureilyticum]
MRILTVFLLCLGALLRPALGHEFWLSPQEYQLPTGGQIVADFRVGENFKGASYPFLPRDTTDFFLITPDGTAPLATRVGDRPALNIPAPADGLAIVVHETTDKRVFYQKPEKFARFVASKDLGQVVADNQSLSRLNPPFSESYRRYAKALIAVGTGQGQDRPTGLETEIVALRNPYTDDLSDGLPIRVLYQGAPRGNVQVEVFEKLPSDTVRTFNLRTDPTGQVAVPVLPGRRYLLNAVVLRPTGQTDPEAGPVWHTLWASTTFAVPD